ncbi:hypothetical protein [Frankia torreyi]|uniref:hypothetical protein n=1 Tax=Frankia torreyi TaxID=1856 RepID=UPI000AF3B4B0|nr:hypothetical protein [Frankia torreyi]
MRGLLVRRLLVRGLLVRRLLVRGCSDADDSGVETSDEVDPAGSGSGPAAARWSNENA